MANFVSHKNSFNQKTGFTLIELLVVISIIGVLASVVLVSLDNARAKARDSVRKQELKSMQQALELYRIDHGHFPRENVAGEDTGNGTICKTCTGGINTILDQYMSSRPEDPTHDGSSYLYYYDGRHSCGGQPNQAIIFAKNLESGSNNRSETICSSFGGEGGSNSTRAYIIVLGKAD